MIWWVRLIDERDDIVGESEAGLGIIQGFQLSLKLEAQKVAERSREKVER